MQEKYKGTTKKVCKKGGKELGKKVWKKSTCSKKVGMKVC